MNYLMYFIIIIIIVILLQQHMTNIKPFQNNNNNNVTNKNNRINNNNDKIKAKNENTKSLDIFQNSSRKVLNTGLKMEEYEGYFGDNLTRFDNATPFKTEIVSKINFSTTHKSTFSQKYTGIFKPSEDGIYKFTLRSDDAAYLYINNILVINNGGLHPPRYRYGNYNVTQANEEYEVVIYFGENYGHEVLQLSYQQPSASNYIFNLEHEFYHQVDFFEYKYSQSMYLKGTVESDENCSINYNSDFITTNGVDKKLFNLQYNYPITISFWANFEKLNNTNSLPYDLISYTNGSKSGWSLSVEINNRLKLDIKKNGNSIINGGLIFDYNIESDTSCFNYYLISFQGFKYINTNNYYVNTTSQFSEIKNQKTFNINFQPNYINYDNSFDNIPEILRDAFFDNITIDNDFRNELDNFSNTRENFTNTKQNIKESFITPNTNPANRIEPKKIEKIDTRSDYEKAKPYIDKIHKYGEFNSPLHNSLKNLQASFHKDFILKNDTKNFNKKIISEIDNHIYELNLENDETNKIKDGQNEKINNLEKSADILNTEIMISKNIDINPYQDKTIKSNNTGSIINHLDNVGNGSFLIRTNDKPGKCLYTSSYKNVSNNTKNCNADDLSQKVNIYDINEDTDYIQHLPKINNTTELHKISNHSEFKYPFKIVKSKNNDQCLHNYDINKYKFNECIPHLGQQFRMWDKETS